MKFNQMMSEVCLGSCTAATDVNEYGAAVCPSCFRTIQVRKDGTIKVHRRYPDR